MLIGRGSSFDFVLSCLWGSSKLIQLRCYTNNLRQFHFNLYNTYNIKHINYSFIINTYINMCNIYRILNLPLLLIYAFHYSVKSNHISDT